LQQLGRGLRRSRNKDILTIFDVTGRQHPNFRFDRHLRELLGHTPRELREFLETGFGRLPSGCVLQFEEHSQRDILERVKRAIPSSLDGLRSLLEAHRGDGWDLATFLRETEVDLLERIGPSTCVSSDNGTYGNIEITDSGRRQQDREPRPHARLALEGDRPAEPKHDPLADREPEPGAVPDRLGREEGLEDPRMDLGRDAHAVVGHLDPGHPVRRGEAPDEDLAVRVRPDRLPRIHEQVDEEDRTFNLRFVG
jgi:hypothetical protein